MIIHGDCLEEMKKMEDNSIDFIVTDPPYALNFMGKDWDSEIPKIDVWKECLRICKPGSWMACFGGTRTFHRLTCLIEDAGWTIRDCICWLYGSGFPKSNNNFGVEGYGTALKPAWEPIILAMKPLDGTFTQNAEKWGVAGINIDECRIGLNGATKRSSQTDYPKKEDGTEDRSQHWARTGHNVEELNKGRWPSNLILDEESSKMLDEMTGNLTSGKPGIRRKPHQTNSMSGTLNLTGNLESGIGDSGGASRFFYCAKASTRERNEGLDKPSSHPTVKPLSLMRYIVKLLSPPGDPVLLDPFCGSGSTCIAALQLGIRSIGIEKNEEYCEIARKRLEYHGQANLKNRQREQRCWQETFDFEENGQEA